MAQKQTAPKRKGWADPEARGYFDVSRGWAASLILLLPLLLIYELGAAYVVSRHSGAADLFKGPLSAFRGREVIVFNVIVIVVVAAAIAYLARRRELRAYYFPFMLIEGVAYGLALERTMVFLMPGVERIIEWARPTFGSAFFRLELGNDTAHTVLDAVIVAAGAGVYEEIIFRGILITALYFLLSDVLRVPAVAAGVASILVAAALFSAAHFVGPGAAGFEPEAFAYRLIAALVLSAIFITRGLGVAAYAHAVHNIVVALHPLLRAG